MAPLVPPSQATINKLKPTRLTQEGMADLSNSFESPFHRLHNPNDLERAIECYREAVELTRDWHPSKPTRFNSLGNAFLTRFHYLCELSDLSQAISNYQAAVQLTADDHPARPGYLGNLAKCFFTRFERSGEPNDLEQAISNYEEAIRLTWDNHSTKLDHLSDLARCFLARFECTGDPSDLDRAISTRQEGVQLTPDGHPNKPSRLNDLGDAFLTRGRPSDLDQAIARQEDAVRLTSDDHPNKLGYINKLVNSLLTRFKLYNELGDLEKAISGQDNAVEVCPDGHPDKAGCLSDLGNSLFTRFQRFGGLDYLEKGISRQREAIEHTADDHPNRRRYLDNLTSYLETGVELVTKLTRVPSLFALIIGIDDYVNLSRLRGAVTDAEAVKQYLKEVFQVSEDCIITLYNAEASRNAIFKAFSDLRDDQRINKGDPIVIFYAGHSGELPAPPSWGVKNKIQCIYPWDYEAANILPIPNRMIYALIECVADVKGDNITVIFDCGHSDFGIHGQHYAPRAAHPDINITETIDDSIWRGRDQQVTDGFASFILLAACSEAECAYEYEGRGQFTTALLAALESSAVNRLTYIELMNRIHLKKQHPQCLGSNQHRVLFGGKVPPSRQRYRYYPVEYCKGDKCVIGVGLAHGVSYGVQITLYDDRMRELGVVMVDESSSINDFETTITTSLPLSGVSFSKLTRVGRLSLHVDNHSVLEETLRRIGANGRTPIHCQIVSDIEEAKLQVAMEGDLVTFNVVDHRVKRFGLTELPYKATLDALAHILGAAAYYYWFLGLTKEYDPINTKDEVIVDLHRLSVDDNDDGLRIYSPIQPGFYQKDSLGSSVIDFVVDPVVYYGIKIANSTPWDLYLNAFLFNISDLSIVPYYTQATAGEPEAPLKQGGTFTIGYGPEGTPLFLYTLEETQDIDVGYLKIFLATRPVDLSDIVQMSPFSSTKAGDRPSNDVHVRPSLKDDRRDDVRNQALQTHDTWFTVLIPVVQRRREIDTEVV